MKKFITFINIILYFVCFNVGAQTGFVSGHLVGKKSGLGVPGVNIISDSGIGTASDGEGNFRLELKPGRHVLTISCVGYETLVRDVLIKESEVTKLDLVIAEQTELLNAVVISAGKFEQKLSEVTVSMDVVKPSFITSNNIASLEEGLQKLSGINILDDQASIRGGSGYSYGAGSRVLLLIDDIPMLTGASGEARWDFAPLENLEQVEIIKGASSALYGSSALNGVVNFRTASPGSKPLTLITTQNGFYGSPGREEIKWWGVNSPVFVGTRFLHTRKLGALDLTFGGNVSSDNGYREHDNESRYRFNINLKYHDQKIKNLSYFVNVNYMERIAETFLIWKDGDSGVYRINDSYMQDIHNKSLNVSPGVIWYYNENTKHSLKTRIYSIKNYNNTAQNNFDDTYYSEYQIQKTIPSLKLVSTSGVAATYNESKSEIYGSTHHFGSSAGFFTQADKKTNRFCFSVGARFEGFRTDIDKIKFKPLFRSGLSYKLNEKTFIRGSAGMGYRYPTIAERYTATRTGAIRIFPNSGLQAESGWSSEIGLKRNLVLGKWNTLFDIAGFYTRYSNMIEFVFGYHNPDSVTLVAYPPTDPGFFLNWVGFRAENISEAEISGIELSYLVDGEIKDILVHFNIGYCYTNPVDLNSQDNNASTDSRILKYRFYNSFKANCDIRYKKMNIGFNFEYQSRIVNIDKAFEDTLRGPDGITPLTDIQGRPALMLPGLLQYRQKNNKGFFIFDIILGWKLNENVSLSANVKNVLNKEYMLRPGDIQPPRNFVFQLTVKV